MVKVIERDSEDKTDEIDEKKPVKGTIVYPNNPDYLLLDAQTGAYKCLDCDEEFSGKGKGHANYHFPKVHAIKVDGTPIKKTPKKVDDPVLDKANRILNDRGENERDPPKDEDEAVYVPETIVIDNINKEIADGATKIAQNINLRYVYAMTKAIFPPEWSFEQFVMFHVIESLERWGIHAPVYQDLESLESDQIRAIKDWRAKWAEKLGEASG